MLNCLVQASRTSRVGLNSRARSVVQQIFHRVVATISRGLNQRRPSNVILGVNSWTLRLEKLLSEGGLVLVKKKSKPKDKTSVRFDSRARNKTKQKNEEREDCSKWWGTKMASLSEDWSPQSQWTALFPPFFHSVFSSIQVNLHRVRSLFWTRCCLLQPCAAQSFVEPWLV